MPNSNLHEKSGKLKMKENINVNIFDKNQKKIQSLVILKYKNKHFTNINDLFE